MITDIELEGIIHEIEASLSEMFFETKILSFVKEVDGSIVVEVRTTEEGIEDIEEELAAKAAELHSEYDYEFIFIVRSENDDESDDDQ